MVPIKTALCSFGMSGRVFHAPFLHLHPGFDFYAVLERTNNVAVSLYSNVKTYRTLDELLKDQAIELVVVNTPNYTHFEYTRKVLNAGKHAVVEKPFTITSAEAAELIELAQKCNKLLSVYQNRRYDSDYKTVKKVLEEGWLGDVVEAEIHYDRFKEELSPKLHKENPGPGSGVVYDLGPHLIDQALQFFGMPDAVFADFTSMRSLSRVEDYMEILCYYQGLRVRIKSSYLVREPVPSYIFHGRKGSFIKARTDVQERLLQEGVMPDKEDWGVEPENERGLLHTERDGKIIREYIPSLRGNYMEFYDGMFEAIRNLKAVPVDPKDGLNVISIIEAAFKSCQQKRVITI